MTGPTRRKRDPLGDQPVDGGVADALRRRRGGGKPLPTALGEQLGAHLGTDLSGVRVHTDEQAGALARSLQASAFTSGDDLYFAPGTYRPESAGGLHMLAHELGHVVQQRTGLDTASGTLRVGAADDPMEAHADRIAERTLTAIRTGPAPSGESIPADTSDGTAGPVRRVWNDEQVYTVIRELVPDLRRQLVGVRQIDDPWDRTAAATLLLHKVESHHDEGRSSASFRLSRTLDSAIAVTDALGVLRVEAQACLYEAELARDLRRAHIDSKVDDYERAKDEMQDGLVAAARRLEALATELVVEFDRPRHAAQAEEAVLSAVNPADTQLDDLMTALGRDQDQWQREIARLVAGKKILQAFINARFEAQDTLQQIEDMLEGTTYATNTTGPLARKMASRIRDALKGTEQASNLLTYDQFPVLQKATDDLTTIYLEMSANEDGALGALAERARELMPRAGQKKGGTNQRTALPAIKQSAAPALRAEMHVDAVKEAKKNPAWMQAAIDFTLNRLALGRVDHIHLAGSNTLIYENRRVWGFMAEHVDSRPMSKQQLNKIKGRSEKKVVSVAVKGGNLHEVVPD